MTNLDSPDTPLTHTRRPRNSTKVEPLHPPKEPEVLKLEEAKARNKAVPMAFVSVDEALMLNQDKLIKWTDTMLYRLPRANQPWMPWTKLEAEPKTEAEHLKLPRNPTLRTPTLRTRTPRTLTPRTPTPRIATPRETGKTAPRPRTRLSPRPPS